jgi:protein-disulfide isomerase
LGSFIAAQQKPAAKKAAPAKKAAAAKPAKSFYNKAELEAYLRHLFVWGPQIKVAIADPKPAANLPGFDKIDVVASAGEAKQEEVFYVSKDGQRILKAAVFEVQQNPFKPELDKIKTDFQPSFGTPGAPVVIVLFTDFECPFCKAEAKMLRENLLSAFPKQVRVYLRTSR